MWTENSSYTQLKNLELPEISYHLSDKDYHVPQTVCVEYLVRFFCFLLKVFYICRCWFL